jgi:hypothetical protein
MDLPCTYTVSIANLRYLPLGASGDLGAVPVAANWSVGAGSGSSESLLLSGPTTFEAAGLSAYGGWNGLTATFPTVTDLSAYRGIAFDLSGSAELGYALAGCAALDNGANPENGRGANPPSQVGAPPSTPTTCPCLESPTATPAPVSAGAAFTLGRVVAVPDPNPNRIAVQIPASCARIRLRIYSAAGVLAYQAAYPAAAAGWLSLPFDFASPAFARGVYYARVQAQGLSGQSAEKIASFALIP